MSDLSINTLLQHYRQSILDNIRDSLARPLWLSAAQAHDMGPLHGPDRKYHDQPLLDEFYEKFLALMDEYDVEFRNGAYAEDYAEFVRGSSWKEIRT